MITDLRTATTESTAVWFSSQAEEDDESSHQFHMLIHAAAPDAAAPGADAPPKTFQLPGALEALAQDPT